MCTCIANSECTMGTACNRSKAGSHDAMVQQLADSQGGREGDAGDAGPMLSKPAAVVGAAEQVRALRPLIPCVDVEALCRGLTIPCVDREPKGCQSVHNDAHIDNDRYR